MIESLTVMRFDMDFGLRPEKKLSCLAPAGLDSSTRGVTEVSMPA
ncbi:hypothetical protein NP603_09085 [Methylomonas sp. SURF-1]|uniref:Uncharacterized protein n=1 Tax=Methylomonas aurea TaxID=2952224 RepID=A0ABT1UGA2_9GAMM|nr:hypothetical protein [Methylomonas sp. SURF-1]MCQ8181262.1 hypothetical protein [Methylomonas sp. SURF-1]